MYILSSCQIVLTEAGIIDRVVAQSGPPGIAGLKTARVEALSFAIRTLTYRGYWSTGRWHRLMSACLLDHSGWRFVPRLPRPSRRPEAERRRAAQCGNHRDLAVFGGIPRNALRQ